MTLMDSFLSEFFGGNVPNPSYQEILRLHKMLDDEDIPHQMTAFFGGWHLGYPNLDDVACSVIEHDGSYGRDEDLLEIIGLLTPEEGGPDDVLGWLTAEEVFERIQKDWEVRRLENKTDVKGDI